MRLVRCLRLGPRSEWLLSPSGGTYACTPSGRSPNAVYGARPSGAGGMVGTGGGIMAGMPGGLAMGGTDVGAGGPAASAMSVGDLAGGPFGGAALGGDRGAMRITSGGAWGESGEVWPRGLG